MGAHLYMGLEMKDKVKIVVKESDAIFKGDCTIEVLRNGKRVKGTSLSPEDPERLADQVAVIVWEYFKEFKDEIVK